MWLCAYGITIIVCSYSGNCMNHKCPDYLGPDFQVSLYDIKA